MKMSACSFSLAVPTATFHRRRQSPASPTTDGVVADKQNHIWAAGYNGPINEYASNANGNATPLRSIHGSKTTIDGANFLTLH